MRWGWVCKSVCDKGGEAGGSMRQQEQEQEEQEGLLIADNPGASRRVNCSFFQTGSAGIGYFCRCVLILI